MRGVLFGLAALAALFVYSDHAQARCFKDIVGTGSRCETINQGRKLSILIPNDTTNLAAVTLGIDIGDAAACDIAVIGADDTASVILHNRQPGLAYPYSIKRLLATGTTCTQVIGIY